MRTINSRPVETAQVAMKTAFGDWRYPVQCATDGTAPLLLLEDAVRVDVCVAVLTPRDSHG